MDITSVCMSAVEKIYIFEETINTITDKAEDTSILNQLKDEIYKQETNLNELQELIEIYSNKLHGALVISKTSNSRKLPKELNSLIKWAEEKTLFSSEYMNNNPGHFKLGKNGFYSSMGISKIKLNEEFSLGIQNILKELTKFNEEFRTKILLTTEWLLKSNEETIQVIESLKNDQILKELDESTIWFWHECFKDVFEVPKKDFIYVLTYVLIDEVFDHDDNRKAEATQIATKMSLSIDTDKDDFITKGEFRTSIFKSTGDKASNLQVYLKAMLEVVKDK